MKKLILVLLLSSSLITGCGFTSEGNFIRNEVKTQGAKAFDEGLANTVWFQCNAASVGSIRRWLGNDKAKAEAYDTICKEGVPIGTELTK